MLLLTKKENIEDKGVIDSKELFAPLFVLEDKINLIQNSLSSLQLNIEGYLSSLNVLFNSKGDIEILEKTRQLNNDVSNSLSEIKGELEGENATKIKELIINELQKCSNVLKKTVKSEIRKVEEFIKIDDGHTVLRDILTLTPRVLPRNPKKFSIGIDIKDNKLKFYDGTWKIIKLE